MNYLKNGSKQFYLKIRFLAAQESENVKVTGNNQWQKV